jgi:hypothetical protein
VHIADVGADVIKIEVRNGTLFERNWADWDLFLKGVNVFDLCANPTSEI